MFIMKSGKCSKSNSAEEALGEVFRLLQDEDAVWI